MPNAFGEDTDEEREDSPLPGVDDDEEMESPRAAGGEAPDEQEEVVPDTQGDAQSTSQAQADAQSTSGAAVTHPSPMLDGAVAECEAAPLDHGAIPLPCLGKRRDLAVGETGVEAASGKRGCHGSVPAHPAAVSEGLTFTALDGTTFKVFRKAPPKKVSGSAARRGPQSSRQRPAPRKHCLCLMLVFRDCACAECGGREGPGKATEGGHLQAGPGGC